MVVAGESGRLRCEAWKWTTLGSDCQPLSSRALLFIRGEAPRLETYTATAESKTLACHGVSLHTRGEASRTTREPTVIYTMPGFSMMASAARLGRQRRDAREQAAMAPDDGEENNSQ